MQRPKSLKVAHDDLGDALVEWDRQNLIYDEEEWPKSFEDGDYPKYFSTSLLIDEHARHIRELVGIVKSMPKIKDRESSEDLVDLKIQCGHMQKVCVELAKAVDDGTEYFLECREPRVLASWEEVCAGVESLAMAAALALIKWRSMVPGADALILEAVRAPVESAMVAAACRKRTSEIKEARAKMVVDKAAA
jgi:hypothetical protein